MHTDPLGYMANIMALEESNFMGTSETWKTKIEFS